MDLFLQTLGVLCLVGIALLLVPVAWLGYKLWQLQRNVRQLMASLGELDALTAPPLRIELHRVSKPNWTDRGQIEQLAGPLRAEGFADAGIFDAEPVVGLRLMALVHPRHEAYAVVYQQQGQGVWLDVVSEYADGRVVSYSTNEHAGLLDPPPFKTSKSLPEATATELLARFLSERPAGARRPVAAASFVESFETAWARECDWRAERGGVTEDEIRRLTSRDGAKADDESIARIRQHWQTAINCHYQEQLMEAFLASGQVTAHEWEQFRDRVLFLHDKQSWDEVIQLASIGFDVDLDDEADRRRHDWDEIERLAAGLAPREAFQRINDRLPTDRRFQQIGQLTQPIPADVYVSPEEDFEDEDEEDV
jgi:hypothetical protein